MASSSPVHLLGRLPFVGDRLLAELVAEAERQRPGGRPGRALGRLAVSRQLREAVGAAAGMAVVPTYAALYQYHRPGAEVRPHLDGPGYDLTFHLSVEHEPEPGQASSVLTVEGVDGPVELPPGHALVLHGQDARHGWTRLGAGERRTLATVGFTPAAGG